jgi:hypothetical protein
MITAAAARRKALFSGGVFLAKYRDRFMTDLAVSDLFNIMINLRCRLLIGLTRQAANRNVAITPPLDPPCQRHA